MQLAPDAASGDTIQYRADENEPDSIGLIKALDKALQIAHENIQSDSFSDTFGIGSNGRLITTKLTIGDAFDNGKYLIVRREIVNYFIDIYLKTGNDYKKVIAHEQWGMTYVSDTIQDINGDGRRDFALTWYGASGCCLKNHIDVYIQLSDGTFSDRLEFINPTFSSREQIIRGVRYGHPGETELYKYKWNKLNVDTIEYIYWDKDAKGHFIKSRYLPYDKRSNEVKKIKLKVVPDEYKNIYGFDWFMNEI